MAQTADETAQDSQPASENATGEESASSPTEDAPPSNPSTPEAPVANAPIEGDESALEALIGVDLIRAKAETFFVWLQTQMLNVDVAVQAVILFAALLPAAFFGPPLKRLIQAEVAPRAPYGFLRRAASAFAHIATPIALFIILQIAVAVLGAFDMSKALVAGGISLLTAWIVIRLVTLVIRSPFWSRVAFYVVWPIAALDAFNILDDVVNQLEAFSFPIGEDSDGQAQRISALDILRTAVIFGVLFWGANFVGGFLKGRIDKIDELTISFKALLGKVLDVLLPVVAFIAALQIVGFPFGTLAIFGGAVGLGIGLGMQRTVSNFFAGFTLIADKSIKPGDVIEVNEVYGWVTEMNSRYVSIRTRDGTNHLVPNDRFIEEGVTNWSHGDRVVRLHAPFGIEYGVDDVRHIARRAEEIVLAVDRVLQSPAPRCNLMEFGDSSINFDLRFWINDPANGVNNVRSDVLMALWDLLKDEGVSIPFPQRDLHIVSAPDAAVQNLAGGRAHAASNTSEA